jgi:hypothetical protein
MLHKVEVVLASDPRIDTVLERVECLEEKLDALLEGAADGRLRVEAVMAEVLSVSDGVSATLRMLRRVITKENKIMAEIDNLEADVRNLSLWRKALRPCWTPWLPRFVRPRRIRPA